MPWKETVSAISFVLYTLVRDLVTTILNFIYPTKQTEIVYYEPTHAIRFDDRVVFTFDRKEVLITILRKQWGELLARVTSWRWTNGPGLVVAKDVSVFGVVKFANKWNQRKNDALSFGKIWFTNGTFFITDN